MPSRGGRGFSLIEVVVAVTIFATLMVLFAGVWPTIARATAQGRQHFVASSLAASVVEQYLATSNAGATVAPSSGSFTVLNTQADVEVSTEYSYTADVDPVGPNLVGVRVAVTWQQQGQSKEVRHAVVLFQP